MDDVIRLLSAADEPVYDEYGNEIEVYDERPVFCKVGSVARNEFYQAAQNNMQPEYVFTISHYKDYLGERLIKYTDWTGKERTFNVIRTYRNGDALEITAEERIGHGN